MRVFVFGNGISVAPTSGRVNVAGITEKLWEWLEKEDLRDFVENLQEWAKPQMVGLDPDAHNYDFELVAGSLHRLGRAVASLTSLADLGVDAADGLLRASEELRGLYRRVVAFVLWQVDCAAWDYGAKAGLVEWDDLNEMAAALVELHKTRTVAVYTLNYDSLLMSALLEQTPWVYDGFRGLALNDPLDPWTNVALYPMHGSIGIYVDATGTLRKRTLKEVRDAGLLMRWAAGEDNGELPQVVLGDTKDTSTLLEPFASYYDQLAGDLSHPATDEVIVGGYGFGDRPLNRSLGLFLAADENHRLRDWRPHATEYTHKVLEALRDPVSEAAGNRIKEEQVIAEDLSLPSGDAVRALCP